MPSFIPRSLAALLCCLGVAEAMQITRRDAPIDSETLVRALGDEAQSSKALPINKFIKSMDGNLLSEAEMHKIVKEVQVSQVRYPRGIVAVIVHGESFRTGRQTSRVVGLPESVPSQQEAAQSQVQHMLQPIRDSGYTVVLFLCTSNTSFNKELMKWYEDFLPDGVQPMFGDARDTATAVKLFEQYESSGGRADHFIFSRPDIIWKQNVAELWKKHRHQVAFTFKEWCLDQTVQGCNGVPADKCLRVPDMMIAMPLTAFNVVRNQSLIGAFGHELFKELVNHGISFENIGFWLDEGYDSDAAKDLNPLYKIAGRPESTLHRHCD